jgi:hypothetical protein
LEPFKTELLVEAIVVHNRPAPLVIVICEILGRAHCPRAASSLIGTYDDVRHRGKRM